MVETLDKGARERQLLRQRADNLTGELDQLEASYLDTCTIFRNVIMALCELGRLSLAPEATQALDGLKESVSGGSFNAGQAHGALVTFRTALLNGALQAEGGAGRAPGTSPNAGKHVAMAMLAGLYINEKRFDQKLDGVIKEVGAYIDSGQVHPAMVMVADLLEDYREVHEHRRRQAEQAMKEVLAELVRTEEEFSEAISLTTDELNKRGVEYEASVTASMGQLARQMAGAAEMETLKANVLEHIRYLRSEIRSKRANEQSLLSKTQQELDKLRTTLNSTREHMQVIEKQSERLSREAFTDPLTKVWNKRALSQQLKEVINQDQLWPLCLIVLDIDYFKSINDNFGHQAGDLALKTIATQAQKALRRKSDILFRYAGDEFVVLLLNTKKDEAMEIAERIRASAEKIRFTYKGMDETRVTLSLGLSEARQGDTPAQLFGRADAALLEAKHSGRNMAMACQST